MKKVLSIILSVLMAFSAFSVMPFSAYSKDYGKTEFNPNVLVRGDTFEMGMYPQSKVTSSSLISTLNGIECTMTNYGYIKKSNAENHTFESTDITYADIEYNNARYRKVLFNEDRPTYTYKESDGYQESNGYPINTVYYFKWEPIVWQVLANEDDGVYVTSKMLLDSQPYNNYKEETSWETCSLRAWMINDFYNSAFSSAEKAKMVAVTNKNDAYWDGTQTYGNDTTDNIWLLSYSDAHNTDYGFISVTSGDYANDDARKMPVTDYAKCQGASTNYDLSRAEWWFRTLTQDSKGAWCCDSTGRYDSYNVSRTSMAIRPAFKLSKEFKHTVSFNAGTGTGSMDPITVADGESITFPENTGFSKQHGSFLGWRVGNEYMLSSTDTMTINQDTTLIAVWQISNSRVVDMTVDNSTSKVLGTLKLTDTRTGEVYTKDVYDEVASSAFGGALNPTVFAMIEEAKDAAKAEAKAKAGDYTVTVKSEDVPDATCSAEEDIDTRGFRFIKTYFESLGDGYPATDDNGDLYAYLVREGDCTRKWTVTVTVEAEFTSAEPAPVISPEDAALPTEEKTEELIKKTNTDKKDVAGSSYAPLMLKATAGKKAVTLKWKKVKGAKGYIIYGAPCGKKMTRLATVTSTKKTFKKLKKGTYYKYIVVAYKKTAAGNRVITKSKSVHCATVGGKKGNPTGVTAPKKLSIKKGKKAKLKAKLQTKQKVATHIAKLRYESSNTKIATVDAKGNIKAKKKGTVKIYVYTQNGICKTVKVTVK